MFYFQLCEDLFNRIRDSDTNEVTYSVEVRFILAVVLLYQKSFQQYIPLNM